MQKGIDVRSVKYNFSIFKIFTLQDFLKKILFEEVKSACTLYFVIGTILNLLLYNFEILLIRALARNIKDSHSWKRISEQLCRSLSSIRLKQCLQFFYVV